VRAISPEINAGCHAVINITTADSSDGRILHELSLEVAAADEVRQIFSLKWPGQHRDS
jgi:hypothetical protein